jgi:hypothetical protein
LPYSSSKGAVSRRWQRCHQRRETVSNTPDFRKERCRPARAHPLGQRLDTADLAVASEAGLQQMKQLDRRVRHPGDTLVSE